MQNSPALQRIRSRFRLAFPALGHRNFRLFFIGQCVSLIGTWMQNIGTGFIAWRLRKALRTRS